MPVQEGSCDLVVGKHYRVTKPGARIEGFWHDDDGRRIDYRRDLTPGESIQYKGFEYSHFGAFQIHKWCMPGGKEFCKNAEFCPVGTSKFGLIPDMSYLEPAVDCLEDAYKLYGVDNLESFARALFDNSKCDAWVVTAGNSLDGVLGLSIGSIVEGVYDTPEPVHLSFPFWPGEFFLAVVELEERADQIWRETHGCEHCGPHDESGYRHVNHECTHCNGEGVIL